MVIVAVCVIAANADRAEVDNPYLATMVATMVGIGPFTLKKVRPVPSGLYHLALIHYPAHRSQTHRVP